MRAKCPDEVPAECAQHLSCYIVATAHGRCPSQPLARAPPVSLASSEGDQVAPAMIRTYKPIELDGYTLLPDAKGSKAQIYDEAMSLEACQEKCNGDPECALMTWFKNDKVCKLYDEAGDSSAARYSADECCDVYVKLGDYGTGLPRSDPMHRIGRRWPEGHPLAEAVYAKEVGDDIQSRVDYARTKANRVMFGETAHLDAASSTGLAGKMTGGYGAALSIAGTILFLRFYICNVQGYLGYCNWEGRSSAVINIVRMCCLGGGALLYLPTKREQSQWVWPGVSCDCTKDFEEKETEDDTTT